MRMDFDSKEDENVDSYICDIVELQNNDMLATLDLKKRKKLKKASSQKLE